MKLKYLRHCSALVSVGLIVGCSAAEDTASEPAPTETSVAPDIATEVQDVVNIETSDKVTSATRSADAHTHGDAELAIVLENGTVTIELDSPLYNILGFEHAPETAEQKTAMTQAEAQLAKADELFSFSDAAGCKVASAPETISLFADMSDHDHDEDHHDDHDDDHKHDDDHHDDHEAGDAHDHDGDEHEHDDDDHDQDTHKDVLLSYTFTCAEPSNLSNVNVNLFEFFDELSEVDVTYLGPSTQKQVELTRTQTQMDISQ